MLNNTPAELRDFTWRWMAGRCQQLPQTTIVSHDPSIVAVVELPDHQTLLTAGEHDAVRSARSASVGESRDDATSGVSTGLAISRDGSLIAAGGNFGCVRAWSGDGTPKLNLTKRGTIVTIALSDDGRHIAYASQVMTGRCEVFRLSLEEAATERVIASDVRNIVQMTMADRDTLLMVMSSDGRIRRFSLDSGVEPQTTAAPVSEVLAACTPDGRTAAQITDRSAGDVQLLDPGTGQLRGIRTSGQPIQSLRFSDDGQSLAAVGDGGMLWEWPLTLSDWSQECKSDEASLSAMTFIDNDRLAVANGTVAEAGRIQFISMNPLIKKPIKTPHTNWIAAISRFPTA